MLERVREILNSDNVRPLTDRVLVRGAENKVINIEADIFLFDLKDTANIAASYETLFKKGNLKLVRICHFLKSSRIYMWVVFIKLF